MAEDSKIGALGSMTLRRHTLYSVPAYSMDRLKKRAPHLRSAAFFRAWSILMTMKKAGPIILIEPAGRDEPEGD